MPVPDLPSDSLAFALLVFMLGLKHGFDADHLATIDGLTRYNAPLRPRLARFCGSLFSIGHGAVVVAIAIGASLLSRGWVAPEWLESTGTWISISFLVLLGCSICVPFMPLSPMKWCVPSASRGAGQGVSGGLPILGESRSWGPCSPCLLTLSVRQRSLQWRVFRQGAGGWLQASG
jgi:hypothetical protein